MGKKQSIDLKTFLDLYEKFTTVETWTKEKHKRFQDVENYLNIHKVVSIRVKPNSKYSHCKRAHSFKILKVPNNQLGKLSLLRNEWVLIICNSFNKGGWSQYINNAYQLAIPFDETEKEAINKRFKNLFIS